MLTPFPKFMAQVTFSSTNSFKASPGWLGSRIHPNQAFNLGIQPNLSPVGFPLQSIPFILTPFSNTISTKLIYQTTNFSLTLVKF